MSTPAHHAPGGGCRCGHKLDFCHVENATRWCGGAWVELRAEADRLRAELTERLVCWQGTKDDLENAARVAKEKGEVWIWSVLDARLRLVDESIEQTEKALGRP